MSGTGTGRDDCTQCAAEGRSHQTLYDRTVVGRARATTRRTRRAAAATLALALLAGGSAASMSPAHAVEYGGFNTFATASPVKLEVFEPAIPIPTEPQFELNLSYTRVIGDSGPNTSARSSALWPGPAIGEGLKTFGEQLGLPAPLTDGGYPVQSNATFPGDETQAASEPLPGQIQRVAAGEKRTTAKAGYTGSGDLEDGDSGDGSTKPTNPLEALQSGDLSALGNLLTGGSTGNQDKPVQTNPLGALGLLVSFDGMTSVSSTDYDGEKVVATATSRIGELRVLLGLIKLTGVNVVTKVTSTLDGGAVTSQTVDVGGITIAGQKFSYGPEGIEAGGKKSPIPGLPANAMDLLKTLGIEFAVPKPVVKKEGRSGTVNAEALVISLDLKPLRSKLPALPLDALVNGLPDLPGQASMLKGLLLSLNSFAPKIALHLGSAAASATTVEQVEFPQGPSGPSGPTDPGTGSGGGTGNLPGGNLGELPVATPPTDGNPITTPPVNVAENIPGLPALGSVPMLLFLAGLALAGGIGWWLRQAGVILFGAGSACTHGLKAGIPDLRKV
jgi:hypothetical protein